MPQQIREVVGVFDKAESLEDSVFELETHGFDRAAFSLLASERTVEGKLGRRYRRVEEMEDEPRAPRDTFFSRVSRLEAEFGLAPALAFIGAVAAGLGSAPVTLPILVAAGSGGLVGAVLGRSIHRRHADRLQEQLERGGILLWVNVRSEQEERKAVSVLQAHTARDVRAHDIAA